MDGNEEKSKLFMAFFLANNVSNDVRFLESGYSNHMSCIRSMFKEFDESYKMQLRLRDDK